MAETLTPAALLKIARVIPRLGSDSDGERLAALAAIERMLRASGSDFTGAGQAMTEFLVEVFDAKEPPELTASHTPSAAAPKGWSSSPPPKPAAPFKPAPQYQAQSAPPPPPPRQQAAHVRPQYAPRPAPPRAAGNPIPPSAEIKIRIEVLNRRATARLSKALQTFIGNLEVKVDLGGVVSQSEFDTLCSIERSARIAGYI